MATGTLEGPLSILANALLWRADRWITLAFINILSAVDACPSSVAVAQVRSEFAHTVAMGTRVWPAWVHEGAEASIGYVALIARTLVAAVGVPAGGIHGAFVQTG